MRVRRRHCRPLPIVGSSSSCRPSGIAVGHRSFVPRPTAARPVSPPKPNHYVARHLHSADPRGGLLDRRTVTGSTRLGSWYSPPGLVFLGAAVVVHGNDDRAALHGGRSEVDRGLAEVRADLDERAKHGVPLRRGVEGHALVRRHEPRRRLGRRAKHRIHPAMLSPDRHPANASDRVSTPMSGWSVNSVDARLEGRDLRGLGQRLSLEDGSRADGLAGHAVIRLQRQPQVMPRARPAVVARSRLG